MKILRRYILREHAGPFIAALGVLTGLMLLNQVARRFADLLGKGLPWYVIGEVFGLSMPFIIAMTLPMAVLVAVLYSFQRLTGDNEVSAFKAGGVSLLTLMIPVLIASSAVAVTMVWFNDKVLPESNHALRQLLTDIARKQPTFELRERVVNEVAANKLFLQAARIDRMRSVLWDLVIFDQSRPTVKRTIYADSGYMAFNATQTDLYLTLFDGSMHELDTNDPGMDQRTYYGKQVIRVEGVSNELQRNSGADWRGDREMNIRMMQDHVEQRRAQLNGLQDTLSELLGSLSPIRYSEAPQPEEETATPTTARDPGAVEKLREPPAPPKTAGQQTRGRRAKPLVDVDEDEAPPDHARSQPAERQPSVQMREIRRRFSLPRAAEWPPDGDPVAFAAQVRSQLERVSSRIELQSREMNKYEVEIQKKFAIPAAAIVFVLIGAPVAVRFPRGGIGMVIGVSLSVFSLYYIFLIGGEDIADRGFMSPFWAMWAPNAIFGALGVGLLYVVSRGGTVRRHRILEWLKGLTPARRAADEAGAATGEEPR